jgi:outer membrane protein TolC
VGNHLLRRQTESQQRQAYFEYQLVRDRVIAEITTAAGDVKSYRQQMDSLIESISAAQDSYQFNLQRIRNAEGLPIELLQAIRARAAARNAYTTAVANYNRAQFRLLRAIGSVPDGFSG